MSVLIHVQHISTVRVCMSTCVVVCVARVVPVLRSVGTGSQRLCYSHYRNICALVRSRSNSCESICPRAPGSLVPPARPDDDRLRNTVFRATRPAGRIKKSIASCLPARAAGHARVRHAPQRRRSSRGTEVGAPFSLALSRCPGPGPNPSAPPVAQLVEIVGRDLRLRRQPPAVREPPRRA